MEKSDWDSLGLINLPGDDAPVGAQPAKNQQDPAAGGGSGLQGRGEV